MNYKRNKQMKAGRDLQTIWKSYSLISRVLSLAPNHAQIHFDIRPWVWGWVRKVPQHVFLKRWQEDVLLHKQKLEVFTNTNWTIRWKRLWGHHYYYYYYYYYYHCCYYHNIINYHYNISFLNIIIIINHSNYKKST